jgi:conjugal transfer/entry exclusion protein
LNEEQLQKILENQARMDERINTLSEQVSDLKNLTETVQRLAITLERQGAALQSTERKVDDVKADVDEIKAKPGKRWDSAVGTVIAVIITAIVTYFLTTAGLK